MARAVTTRHKTIGTIAASIVALLIFFVFALQCVSTLAAMKRETGTWRWPLIAWSTYLVVAWVAAFAAKSITDVFL